MVYISRKVLSILLPLLSLAPVDVDKVEASTGGQMSTSVDMLPYATPNADKTVWTIKPGSSFWESSDNSWMFMVYAKDENGLVVKGNFGEDADSYYEYSMSTNS